MAASQSRQYTFACNRDPSPPPPPPPRSQGLLLPPPATPPRGTTPSPLYSSSSSVGATIVNSVGGQRPVLLSRLSPGPSKTKTSANYVNINSVSQNSSHRGTSPISHVCRQPIVPQNCPQIHQQITNQIQALSLTTNNTSHNLSTQTDRPPPYPVVSQVKTLVAGVKMGTPPPSYNAILPCKMNSTVDNRLSPPQLTYQTGLVNSYAVPPPTSASPTLPTTTTSNPVIRGGQTARQAKTPTPIIMQSVKSMQVQKPVLQTAVAPASPVTLPPPSYASSIQQKQVQAPSSTPSTPESPSPLLPNNYQSPCVSSSVPVPTTDPPSYHSTMQAMAAARGYCYMPQSFASIPVQDVLVQDLDLSSTPLAHIPISQVNTVDSIVTTQPSSQVEIVSTCHDINFNNHMASQLLHQRKFSPIPTDTLSNASRSGSPSSLSMNSHDAHVLSPSPVSCFSAVTSTPSTQSDMTQESGYSSSSQSARGMPPPPPPVPTTSVHKTMHQSPIPERKKISSELEEQRGESKVKVYSPEAYKFFMEQHVENIIKLHDQRKQRKIQLEKEMKKIGLSSKDQSEMRKLLSQKESNYIRLKRAKMNKMMFEPIKLIG